MFWDGFQWVTKTSATGVTADPSLLTQTKKMRRLLISNLPLQLGLGEKEIGEFVTKFIIENYLNDDGNFQPVKEVIVDTVKNSATIELSSVEEAGRLAKVEGKIFFIFNRSMFFVYVLFVYLFELALILF